MKYILGENTKWRFLPNIELIDNKIMNLDIGIKEFYDESIKLENEKNREMSVINN